MIPISEEINQNGGIPGWLELHNLSLHGDIEARSPSGAYIKGIINEEDQFSPTSEILGQAIPQPEDIGQNSGWVELETRRFHSDIEAVTPRPPYVHGLRDHEAHFYPDEPYRIITH